MTPVQVVADPHLMDRLRSAGASIGWRDGDPSEAGARARIAHLHDEEARVEERRTPTTRSVLADAGPVGALVLLLEVDRTGALPYLSSVPAGVDPGFPGGAIFARWPPDPEVFPRAPEIPIADLVLLARYALV